MKKILLILLASSVMNFAYAQNQPKSQLNKDESNIYDAVHLVKSMYLNQPTFKGVENIYAFANFAKAPDYTHLVQFSTKNNNKTAIIRYKTKYCNSLQTIQGKLINTKTLKVSDYINCQNNMFVAEINK